MQVRGGPEVTLSPGQTYYEGPSDVHIVGRNASNTQPAKFIVFLVKAKDAPILTLVKSLDPVSTSSRRLGGYRRTWPNVRIRARRPGRRRWARSCRSRCLVVRATAPLCGPARAPASDVADSTEMSWLSLEPSSDFYCSRCA